MQILFSYSEAETICLFEPRDRFKEIVYNTCSAIVSLLCRRHFLPLRGGLDSISPPAAPRRVSPPLPPCLAPYPRLNSITLWLKLPCFYRCLSLPFSLDGDSADCALSQFCRLPLMFPQSSLSETFLIPAHQLRKPTVRERDLLPYVALDSKDGLNPINTDTVLACPE